MDPIGLNNQLSGRFPWSRWLHHTYGTVRYVPCGLYSVLCGTAKRDWLGYQCRNTLDVYLATRQAPCASSAGAASTTTASAARAINRATTGWAWLLGFVGLPRVLRPAFIHGAERARSTRGEANGPRAVAPARRAPNVSPRCARRSTEPACVPLTTTDWPFAGAGSPQHAWLEASLERAARNRTALGGVDWVVFSVHRPVLCSDASEWVAHRPGAPMHQALGPPVTQTHAPAPAPAPCFRVK